MSEAPERAWAGQDRSPSRAVSVSSLPRRDLVVILSSLALATVLAWLYLIHLERSMSAAGTPMDLAMALGASMDMSWKASDLFFTFAMWVVMMVGMMGPSAAPMILVFAAAQARRKRAGASLAAGLFAAGYVAIWAAFSWLAALAEGGLHQAALLSRSMAVSNARLGGAVVLLAGIYQLTWWKNRCLLGCRSPLDFLMTHWRQGRAGGFRMGLSHGLYCLGCCWALMSVLFAVGVMNLVWVAALAAVVLLEKILPGGIWIARGSGAALIVYGANRLW